jgi:hypothetical protein
MFSLCVFVMSLPDETGDVFVPPPAVLRAMDENRA